MTKADAMDNPSTAQTQCPGRAGAAKPFAVASALGLVAAFALLAAPAASAEAYLCSTYREVTTKGGQGTTEKYGRDCAVAINEGGHLACIGYAEDTVNHYNDPNNRSSTTTSESCDRSIGTANST